MLPMEAYVQFTNPLHWCTNDEKHQRRIINGQTARYYVLDVELVDKPKYSYYFLIWVKRGVRTGGVELPPNPDAPPPNAPNPPPPLGFPPKDWNPPATPAKPAHVAHQYNSLSSTFTHSSRAHSVYKWFIACIMKVSPPAKADMKSHSLVIWIVKCCKG